MLKNWLFVSERLVPLAVAMYASTPQLPHFSWAVGVAGGHPKWHQVLLQLQEQYATKGQINMAAMLSVVMHDPLQAIQYYRRVGKAAASRRPFYTHLCKDQPLSLYPEWVNAAIDVCSQPKACCIASLRLTTWFDLAAGTASKGLHTAVDHYIVCSAHYTPALSSTDQIVPGVSRPLLQTSSQHM